MMKKCIQNIPIFRDKDGNPVVVYPCRCPSLLPRFMACNAGSVPYYSIVVEEDGEAYSPLCPHNRKEKG